MKSILHLSNVRITNIALCLFAILLSIGIVEYALRQINIEGLSGKRIHIGTLNSSFFILPEQVVDITGINFEFTIGDCYPSNANSFSQFKIINPDDGKPWYCVLYDKKQRREGYNPDRKRQIAIVGDSFVFGDGVKDKDTLGYLLNTMSVQINFQNWGQSGANIDDIVAQCKEIIKSVPKVDEVIYFYNLNDVRMSEEIRAHQNNIIDFQNIRWAKDEQQYSPVGKVLSKSALFSLARKAWVLQRESFLTVRNYQDMYLSQKNQREFLLTMDDIRSIKDMLEAQGISFRVIIYPILYKDMLGRYPFESIHTTIIKACNELGVSCLDGYEPFRKDYSLKKFTVHPLDYHPNGLSNRKIVHYIYQKGFMTILD